nr:hypothetical protein [Alcaligenes faecalis]
MKASLEDRFQSFLDGLPYSQKIVPGRPNVGHGEKQADYLLHEGKIVAEIKALKEPQSQKGESVVNEYLDDFDAKVFGTLPLSRVAKSDEHLLVLDKTISRRMTRGIERVCRSANEQIGAEFNRLPHLATGVLILINENLSDLHPRAVADRVVDFTRSKVTNIHYCLLVFESHLARINNRLLPYPLLLDLTYSARQRRLRSFLKSIQNDWAKQNGFPNGLPDPEPREIEYHPDSIILGR